MKRMNLLPAELRPRDGGRRGSSYFVIAALGVAIIAMLAYGAVIRGVRSDESDLATLKEETQRAHEQADALNPYAEFTNMKETRARSVRAVAETRFDYERLTRELARILPSGVWVSHLEVSPAGPTAEAAEKGADSPDAATGSPMMSVTGCARSQDAVADTLDRLRALTGATGVALGSSGTDSAGGSGAPAPAPEAGGGGGEQYLVSGADEGSGGGGGCGSAGRPRVSFDLTITLAAPGTDGSSGS